MSLLNRRTYTLTTLVSTAACVGNAYFYDNGTNFVANLVRSKLNILIMVNMAYCSLFYFGKLIQHIVFGPLRDAESQNLTDRLLNYILLKIVFVGAVLEPELRELLVWVSWFSILGFMRVFSLLARDRFEYIITFSPNAAVSTHVRILVLLMVILLFDLGWFYLCVSHFYVAGASIVLLLTFECFTLFLDTIQTLVKYGIHLIDLRREGLWEQRGMYIYYTEFVTDSLVLLATLAHYIQILALNGISFTLIDVIIFFQMRAVFNNLREKLISYRNYRTLVIALNSGYENVTPEELTAHNDDCAICRERMSTAKKLPCGHIFHMSCLRSWLEQHHSCPTCRRSLIDSNDPLRRGGQAPPMAQHGGFPANLNMQRGMGINFGMPDNRFGLFSFGFQNPAVIQEMVRSLRDTFPHVPEHVIAADLARTRSAELTADNIMEGRLVWNDPPAPRDDWPPQPAATPTAPQVPRTPVPQSPATASPLPSSSSSSTSVASPVSPSSISSPSLADALKSPTQVPSTPAERQALMAARKQALKEQALKRYLEKTQSQPVLPSPTASTTSTPSTPSSPFTPSVSSMPTLPSSPITSPAASHNYTPSSPITPASSATTTILTSSSSSIPRNTSSSSIDALEEEPLEVRRRRLIEAAERRMRQSTSRENLSKYGDKQQ